MTWSQTKYRGLHQIPGLRGWLLKDPTSDKRTLPHATQAERHSDGCEKISMTTSPLKSSFLNPQIAIALMIIKVMAICLGAVGQETKKTPCNTKDELKSRIMAPFKQGDS